MSIARKYQGASPELVPNGPAGPIWRQFGVQLNGIEFRERPYDYE
jgi:hypothetical protein